jgi:hypothetical protein
MMDINNPSAVNSFGRSIDNSIRVRPLKGVDVPDKWFGDVESMLDYQVRKGNDGGMTWKDFSSQLVSGCIGPDQVYYKYKTDYWHEGGGFPTPSKKFEFKSQHLEKLGYDGLPVFREPGESPVSTPELYKEYPLLMSTGFRQPFYFLGQYRNIPWLRSYLEFPECQMHPETAKQYGVEDGDIIWIETKRGRIRQKLHEFPGISDRHHARTAAVGIHGFLASERHHQVAKFLQGHADAQPRLSPIDDTEDNFPFIEADGCSWMALSMALRDLTHDLASRILNDDRKAADHLFWI